MTDCVGQRKVWVFQSTSDISGMYLQERSFQSDKIILLRFIVLHASFVPYFREHGIKAFPDLRATIIKDYTHQLASFDPNLSAEYSAGLFILRNITLAILSSTLKYQLKWCYGGEERPRRCITSISLIVGPPDATVTIGDPAVNSLFKPLHTQSVLVRIPEDRGQGDSHEGRFEKSIGAIRHMMLSSDSTPALSVVTSVLKKQVRQASMYGSPK